MGKLKTELRLLKEYYGIEFDLEEQEKYEILGDMDNIESYFNRIRRLLDKK